VACCVQQQRRSRTSRSSTVQTTLRKLRALDAILAVGRGVRAQDKGAPAGEEVLVECMQCLLALVQVRPRMHAWCACVRKWEACHTFSQRGAGAWENVRKYVLRSCCGRPF
jgi:hypothetical protein